MRKIYFILVLALFFSCEKEEIAISTHSPGNIEIQQVELGEQYTLQIFYDLGTKTTTYQNKKTDWDLAFESSADGFHVILNSSTFSALSYIGNLSFSDTIISTNNLNWSWDNPNGKLDSTAFGDYRELTGFFIIDRGYNLNGSQRGFKKIRIDSITSTYYKITYSNLDNSEYHALEIYKDPSVNFTSFSFTQNNIVTIQPPSEEWDLVFTQYTQLFNNPETPAYLVTGVISNYQVLIAEDTSHNFENITFDLIDDLSFSNNCDIIGYDWKQYIFETSSFSINSNINYVIKDRQKRYFKLRFIDFYNDLGEKGCPKFELQEL